MTTTPCSCEEALSLRAQRDAAIAERDDAIRDRNTVMARETGHLVKTLGELRDLRAVLADTKENRDVVAAAISRAYHRLTAFYGQAGEVLGALRERAALSSRVPPSVPPETGPHPEDGKPTDRCACGSIAVTRTGCSASTEESVITWGPWVCSRCKCARYADEPAPTPSVPPEVKP